MKLHTMCIFIIPGMGTYKINLKKSNNKNGFIITNMKQTVNKKL